jgi:hypothetical protein
MGFLSKHEDTGELIRGEMTGVRKCLCHKISDIQHDIGFSSSHLHVWISGCGQLTRLEGTQSSC